MAECRCGERRRRGDGAVRTQCGEETVSAPARPAALARLVVLASGGGSNLQAILDACASGTIAADVVAVVSNVPDCGAFTRASASNVRGVCVLPERHETRADYDRRLADVVAACEPDWIVLAGWMRLLTMEFLGGFPGRVVNLHPGLPGELPGTKAIERAHAESLAGTRTRTGVMVHLVPDEGVDDGPVLASETVLIHQGESLPSLTARIHEVEHRLLVDTLAGLTSRTVTPVGHSPGVR